MNLAREETELGEVRGVTLVLFGPYSDRTWEVRRLPLALNGGNWLTSGGEGFSTWPANFATREEAEQAALRWALTGNDLENHDER